MRYDCSAKTLEALSISVLVITIFGQWKSPAYRLAAWSHGLTCMYYSVLTTYQPDKHASTVKRNISFMPL
jgi:hypothetical protein